MTFYSFDANSGYEKLDLNTQYCYVDFMNVPKFGGDNRTDTLFNLYSEFIKSHQGSLISFQKTEFFNTLCDKHGYKLIDAAMLDGTNPVFVRYLIEEKRVNINHIPFQAKMTTTAALLKSISPDDENYLNQVKIIGIALKNSGLAFDLSAYEYDETELNDNITEPEDLIYANMNAQTIYYVQDFIHDAICDLGINDEYDAKILEALEMFAKMGFLPCAQDETLPSYQKYYLSDMFNNVTLYKQSYTLSSSMLELISSDITECENEFDYEVVRANMLGGFAIPQDIDIYMASQDSETEDDLDAEEYDESEEGLEEEIDGEPEEYYDEEYEDEDEQETQDGENTMEITYVKRYGLDELVQIAKKNMAYAEECEEVAKLYEDTKKYKEFQEKVQDLIMLKRHLNSLKEHQKYLNAMVAQRNNDETDDHIFHLATVKKSNDNNNEEAK